MHSRLRGQCGPPSSSSLGADLRLCVRVLCAVKLDAGARCWHFGYPRREGWPCFRKHVTRACGNQHAAWMTCQRCALRTSYVTKAVGHGQRQALGIAAKILGCSEFRGLHGEDCDGQDYGSEGATASGKRRRAGLLRETGHQRPGREVDGPTSTWLSRHCPAAGREEPSVKTEDLCRETGGADQEWEELDRPKQQPHQLLIKLLIKLLMKLLIKLLIKLLMKLLMKLLTKLLINLCSCLYSFL